MPDWDENSPRLGRNAAQVLLTAKASSASRLPPAPTLARDWHTRLMDGLTVPDASLIGRFRGEKGLEGYEVRIGGHFGTLSINVGKALRQFFQIFQAKVDRLDRQIAPGTLPAGVQLVQVIDLCAWVHAEWVRIHPFANGNGRIARVWANFIAMRYGLPPFVGIRPRPRHGYGPACNAAMKGDWRPTAISFHSMLAELLNSTP